MTATRFDGPEPLRTPARRDPYRDWHNAYAADVRRGYDPPTPWDPDQRTHGRATPAYWRDLPPLKAKTKVP